MKASFRPCVDPSALVALWATKDGSVAYPAVVAGDIGPSTWDEVTSGNEELSAVRTSSRRDPVVSAVHVGRMEGAAGWLRSASGHRLGTVREVAK
jgi:ABC-type sugar transport system substrate-binding protein